MLVEDSAQGGADNPIVVEGARVRGSMKPEGMPQERA